MTEKTQFEMRMEIFDSMPRNLRDFVNYNESGISIDNVVALYRKYIATGFRDENVLAELVLRDLKAFDRYLLKVAESKLHSKPNSRDLDYSKSLSERLESIRP